MAVACVCVSSTSAQALKQITESPNMKKAIAAHKTVAILPFKYVIEYKKLPKNTTAEDIKASELKEGVNAQNSMLTFLLRKIDNYTVSFQDVNKTRTLLNRANITQETLENFTFEEIAKALSVDAVIYGNITTSQMMNQGGAVALQMVTGTAVRNNEATAVITIYDGVSGESLWRYSRELGGSAYSNSDDLIDALMRQIARNFPYSKK